MNINKCICTGRLTKDPELKALPSGTSVCELRLAVDGMGRGHEVGYINVSVFGSGGEAAAEYLSKGCSWRLTDVSSTASGRSREPSATTTAWWATSSS